MRRHRNLAHLFGEKSALAWPAPWGNGLSRLRTDKRGAAALVTAFMATGLLGAAGLAVEVGGWFLLHRNMQAAADAASLAAALNFENNYSTSQAEAAARSVTARNGFAHGMNGTVVTPVVNPDTGRVTVTVERPQTSRLFTIAQISNPTRTVQARAVGQVVNAGAPPCVHATVGSVAIGNNTNVTAPNCALASDSASVDALKIGSGGSVANGAGVVTAANIITHGGCEGCAEATTSSKLVMTRAPFPSTYAPKTANAYKSLDSWTPTPPVACINMPSLLPLPVGCYDSINVQPNRTVSLLPGVYYIRGGGLNVQGTLNCPTCTDSLGVSIVLLSNGTQAPGKVDINADATIDLHAGLQPLQTRLDGVLIYRQPSNAATSTNGKGEININGSAKVKLDGAIVGTDSRVTMSGSGATSDKSCNIFVVHSMEFSGNSELSAAGCDLYGTKRSEPRMPRLVQ